MTLSPDATVGEARGIMRGQNISGLPIVEWLEEGRRDPDAPRHELPRARRDARQGGDDLQGPRHRAEGTSLDEARERLHLHKVEKLIIVDGDGHLAGLITRKDLDMLEAYPNSNSDERGRLRVGAALGVHDYERAEALVDVDVDVVVVDTAHGHTSNVMKSVAELKKRFQVDVVAGNVATAEAGRASSTPASTA